MNSHLLRLRALGVAGVVSALLAAAITWLSVDALTPTSGGGDAGIAVTRICEVSLMVALTWAWVTVLAGVVEAWRLAERPAARPVMAQPVGAHPSGTQPVGTHPVGVRRLVLAACGVALGALATTAGGAQAVPAGPAVHAVGAAASQPGAPSSAQATTVTTEAALSARVVTSVVVRRGDCLWSIAASEVQPGAGPMTVTARWRALYRANRGAIGTDPDLIRPGLRLRMPR